MGGSDKGVGSGDDFAADLQRLQCGNQGESAICKQTEVLDAQIVCQLSLELGMERSSVGELFARPDLFQVRQKLC